MKSEEEFKAWVNLVLWRAVEFHDIDENLIHSPRDFDVILYPSSLYHQTIPFDSQDERHSIAFDVVKKI